ncbi:TetR/AcrR family transcriptional regulator [Alphaproteobacteria bacterium]|nr:TetR/AcrR family transcriptional regulator [Alphaproteobacteria bacterium]
MDKQKKYHHGDLKNLLISKVLEAVKKNNLENFSIRDASRLLNVSPAAPYKHFPDKQALIISSILYCQNIFYIYLCEQVEKNIFSSHMQLINLGKCYLKYANENPEIFVFMFSLPLSDKDRLHNYDKFHKLFISTIKENLDEDSFRKRVSISSAVNAAWSMAHGIACLIASKTISDDEVEGYINGKLFDEISAIWAVGVSKPPKYKV